MLRGMIASTTLSAKARFSIIIETALMTELEVTLVKEFLFDEKRLDPIL